MMVLGLDPSQTTGWSLYDTAAHVSAMRCGCLKISAVKGDFEGNAGHLGLALVKLLTERRDPATGKPILPDFAIVERAPRQQFGGKRAGHVKFMGADVPSQDGDDAKGPGLQGTLSTNQMAAALCAILGAYKIPYETMTDAEWRKASYGFGRKSGWTRPDWKRHARQMCAQMRITATNDDMAEACWIAYAGSGHQAFKKLEYDRAQAAAKMMARERAA